MNDIAVVVLDTLRKDRFDEHFDWLPGRRFERAFSTANWTVPAHASLFTGRYASEVGVHAKNMHLDCPETALAERLQDAGYNTRAYSANTNVTGHFNFDRGFTDFRVPKRFEHLGDDRLFDWREFNRGTTEEGIRKYVAAVRACVASDSATVPSLLAGARTVLSNNDEGVEYGGTIEAIEEVRSMEFGSDEFLFLNLMEAHEPYEAPNEYMRTDGVELTQAIGDLHLGEKNHDAIKIAYDDCARYLSDVYADLFDMLETNYDYVITLSDHGEMLGEYDAWGHEYGVYPQLTHVPLVISGDGLSGTCCSPVSLVDVHQTILELADVDCGDGRGQPLLGTLEDSEFLTEYLGLTSWSERKFEKLSSGAQFETYDQVRRGYVSPDGGYNFETPYGLKQSDSTDIENAQRRLEELVEGINVRDVGRGANIPEEVEQQLKDLGYA